MYSYHVCLLLFVGLIDYLLLLRMRLKIVAAALVAALGWGGVVGVVDAFSASSNANLAVYYGQNSRNIVGAQGNLAAYCQGIQCS